MLKNIKIKIKPYILYLIKENIVYIFSFFFILIFLFSVVFIGINKITKINNQKKELEDELVLLRKKVFNFNYDEEKEKKISEAVEVLNMLIPNVEDYFSIIYSLEKLSYKTGFMIIGYSIDLLSSSPNKIRLTVTGTGDSNSFLNFLSEYNFGGGRLITSDKAEYNTQKNDVIKMNLTFYNKNPKSSFSEKNNYFSDKKIDEILEEIEKIKEKIVFDFSKSEDETNFFDYSQKSNPFQ